jgi:transcriptional regulator with PAS, ATPase and Fis domain
LHLKEFITIEDETLRMKEDARKIAKSEHEVLITGETGTGKELIAKSMIGERIGAIKAVNCAGFPSELIESELFGHIRGSFTGANTEKEGLLSAAKDGIMFLDEVGELPMHVQAKLLRALQDKSIRKVGSNVEEKITCKFVCATHRNLKKMVESKEFRQDLYARISTLELHIKPLRDRKCDIVPITESLKGGKDFLLKHQDELPLLDLSLNVRSLQQHVIRFAVLGRLVK